MVAQQSAILVFFIRGGKIPSGIPGLTITVVFFVIREVIRNETFKSPDKVSATGTWVILSALL